MNAEDEVMIRDLNELLRGCHMGAAAFREYLVQAQSEKLRETLNRSLQRVEKHETELTSRVNAYGAGAPECAGVMAMLSQAAEKIKVMMADSDEDILNQSLRAMDMGLKACYDFIEKHRPVPGEMLFVIHELQQDYKEVVRELTELKLNAL